MNHEGDSIKLNVAAVQGESWEFYRFAPNKYITAYADTVEYQTFLGISDSVKIIKFETLVDGILDLEWIDRVEIRLSQNTGSFQVYPNPSSGPIKFKNRSESRVRIFSLNGELVYTADSSNEIKSGELNPGIYFATNGDETRKLVVIR